LLEVFYILESKGLLALMMSLRENDKDNGYKKGVVPPHVLLPTKAMTIW